MAILSIALCPLAAKAQNQFDDIIEEAIDDYLKNQPTDSEMMDASLERLKELEYDDEDFQDRAVYEAAVDCAHDSQDPKFTEAESNGEFAMCWNLCESMKPRFEGICKASADFGAAFGRSMASQSGG